jgi:hypothetical protein
VETFRILLLLFLLLLLTFACCLIHRGLFDEEILWEVEKLLAFPWMAFLDDFVPFFNLQCIVVEIINYHLATHHFGFYSSSLLPGRFTRSIDKSQILYKSWLACPS